MDAPERPQSLRAAFAAAEKQRRAIEDGTISFANSSSGLSYGDAVAAVVAAYADCDTRIARLALFSANEAADDIATAHLPYLLVPLRMADMVQRQPPSPAVLANPAALPEERRGVLRQARTLYEQFLHRADGYGLLATPYAKLLQRYTADPVHFSVVGSSESSSNSGSREAALTASTARRNAKIASFQAEKALRAKLAVLRARQEEQRKRRQQRTGEQEEEEDGEEDEEGEDDETSRELYLAELAFGVHMAFQSLEGLAMEDEMLSRAPTAPANNPGRMGGLGDNRQRTGGPAALSYTDRLEQQVGTLGGRMQGALGSTTTWAGAGPLLTADGKPKQPFTILGSRAEMARAVFRPGHNLPTMSIDEYLEEERRRGGIIEGGGPSSGLRPEPDEDNIAKADEETMKAREWDEFKEANPRGSGNTLNRG